MILWWCYASLAACQLLIQNETLQCTNLTRHVTSFIFYVWIEEMYCTVPLDCASYQRVINTDMLSNSFWHLKRLTHPPFAAPKLFFKDLCVKLSACNTSIDSNQFCIVKKTQRAVFRTSHKIKAQSRSSSGLISLTWESCST